MLNNDFLIKWYKIIDSRYSLVRKYKIENGHKIKIKWPVAKMIKNTTNEKWKIIWDESLKIDKDFNIIVTEQENNE
ncbi:hypothetical protein AB8O52_00235 [Mycoplasmopsis arginini]|uniref:hypothetical protein n=1 Tax=Mycoplasmopsis arginini TaxID=2094 RepID=UPI003518C65B